jgi:excisionase family DNA binding protein
MAIAIGEVVSVSDISASLRVSGRTARRLIQNGDVKAHRIGRQWRVFRSDLEEYLARNSNLRAAKDSPAVGAVPSPKEGRAA